MHYTYMDAMYILAGNNLIIFSISATVAVNSSGNRLI